MQNVITAGSFCDQLEEIFAFLKERIDRSAGQLMGSLGNVETAGYERMASMQASLEESLLQHMEQDTDIRRDIWQEGFTKELFVRFIVMNMTTLWKTRASDIHFFLAIVKRIIY